MRVIAMAAVLTMGAMTVACGAGTSSEHAAGSDPPVVAVDLSGSTTVAVPPSAATAALSEIELWFSARQVEPGTEIAAMLVNRSGVEATFGVAAEIDRWDGSGWVADRHLDLCHQLCTGVPRPADDGHGHDDIGLLSSPRAAGPLTRFSMAGSEPGWYRIRQLGNDGAVASGVLEVVTADPAGTAPLLPVDVASFSVRPALLAPDGGSVWLTPAVPGLAGASAEGIDATFEGASESATIRRWDGSGWTPVGTVDLYVDCGVPPIGPERGARLPPLPAGAYHLVRNGPQGELEGMFWIADDAPSVAAPPPSDTPPTTVAATA